MENVEVLPPTILVIFGITGDLSRRYLLPSLAEIVNTGHVKDNFVILGVSRRESDVSKVIPKDCAPLKSKTQLLQMDVGQPADYLKLKDRIKELKNTLGAGTQVIFYFAVPPGTVLPIVRLLGTEQLNGPGTKLLLEKPFGADLASATTLIDQISKYFKEERVYRIDHYLAKEMAQNLTVFLGSNAIFRNIWDNRFIEKIEIDVLEKIGIEGRAEFYESTGALRDIIQSHSLQLAALVLMEPCSDIFDFQEIPRRRLAALKDIQPITDAANATRGQYKSYKKEASVPDSHIETFVRLNLSSRDSRWKGVPITLTTGKKLEKRLTEIRVYFKPEASKKQNILRLRIQPHEGIELDLWVKQPGYSRRLQKLSLDFSYQQHFSHLPNAYEQVLIDAMMGNHSLFASSGEILASWKILDPVIELWKKSNSDLIIYKDGSEANQVLDKQV